MKNNNTIFFKLLTLASIGLCIHNAHGMEQDTAREFSYVPREIKVYFRNLNEGIGHHLTRHDCDPVDLLEEKVAVTHMYADVENTYTIDDVQSSANEARPARPLMPRLEYYDYVVKLLKKTDHSLPESSDLPTNVVARDRRERVICAFNLGVKPNNPSLSAYGRRAQTVNSPINQETRTYFTAEGIGNPLEKRTSIHSRTLLEKGTYITLTGPREFRFYKEFDLFDGNALEKDDTVIINPQSQTKEPSKKYTVVSDSNRTASENNGKPGFTKEDRREIVLLSAPQERVIEQSLFNTRIQTYAERVALEQIRRAVNDDKYLEEETESATTLVDVTYDSHPTRLKQGLAIASVAATIAAAWYVYSWFKP